MNFLKKHKNEMILFAGSLAVSYGTRLIVRGMWKLVSGYYPKENPEEEGVTTAQALTWSISLAIVGGLAKLLFRKSATRRLMG